MSPEMLFRDKNRRLTDMPNVLRIVSLQRSSTPETLNLSPARSRPRGGDGDLTEQHSGGSNMSWLLRLAVVAATTLALARPAPAAVSALKVMTFNVWSGEGTAAGRNKLAEIISASGADIVGVQELDDAAGRSIATTLGFHYHQQSGGDIQILSRYAIVGQSSSNLGARIELSPGQQVWLFNAHLAAYPYQPYDLRDGILPMSEAAVIAAADAARGGQVTSYLNDVAGAMASGLPVFFTGDFNEPSHLDWTAAAAEATARPFDLDVEYPTSKRIVDAGFTDSFRDVRPEVTGDRAYTWTPGAPPPNLDPDEVFDRIDIVYHAGLGVDATGAITVGYPDGSADTDLAIPGYNADHRAVVVDYAITSRVFGDFNIDNLLNAEDWTILRSNQLGDLSGLSIDDAYLKGDLNGDRRNDHADFVAFKQLFDGLNGAGAFAAMVAAVPEPGAGTLMAIAVAAIVRRRSPRRSPSARVVAAPARDAARNSASGRRPNGKPAWPRLHTSAIARAAAAGRDTPAQRRPTAVLEPRRRVALDPAGQQPGPRTEFRPTHQSVLARATSPEGP
jgi:endonuclease/exonuclease/phosphatase family metal-dependent hydrolase